MLPHSRYLAFLSFLLITGGLSAQPLSGRVTDSLENTVLAYATVLRYDAENAFLDGTVTDEPGAFELPANPVGRWVEVTFVGYLPRRIGLTADGQKLVVKLQAEGSLLSTVEVRSERTRVRKLIDRRVIEVGQDLQSAGGDAATILRLLPDVQLNGNDHLQLRGSDNVTVLSEDYRVNAEYSTLSEPVELIFGNIFPSTHLLWEPQEDIILSLAYNRRTYPAPSLSPEPFSLTSLFHGTLAR